MTVWWLSNKSNIDGSCGDQLHLTGFFENALNNSAIVVVIVIPIVVVVDLRGAEQLADCSLSRCLKNTIILLPLLVDTLLDLHFLWTNLQIASSLVVLWGTTDVIILLLLLLVLLHLIVLGVLVTVAIVLLYSGLLCVSYTASPSCWRPIRRIVLLVSSRYNVVILLGMVRVGVGLLLLLLVGGGNSTSASTCYLSHTWGCLGVSFALPICHMIRNALWLLLVPCSSIARSSILLPSADIMSWCCSHRWWWCSVNEFARDKFQ